MINSIIDRRDNMNNTDKEFVKAISDFRTGNKLPYWINSEDEPFPIDRSFLAA